MGSETLEEEGRAFEVGAVSWCCGHTVSGQSESGQAFIQSSQGCTKRHVVGCF